MLGRDLPTTDKDFAAGVYLSEAQNPERRLDVKQFTKLSRKYQHD